MGHQPHALCGQAYPPTDPLQQAARTSRSKVASCCDTAEEVSPKVVPDRGYGSAMGKFSEQPETREIEHKVNLTKDAGLLKWICEDAGR